MTKKIFVLVVLTCSYLVGEIAHFLTAVTSKHIANSIGFGEQKCYYRPAAGAAASRVKKRLDPRLPPPPPVLLQDEDMQPEYTDPENVGYVMQDQEQQDQENDFDGNLIAHNDTVCDGLEEKHSCEEFTSCRWEYTGHGMEYQVLVGPAYIIVFTISGIFMGLLADRISRPRLLGCCVLVYSTSCALSGLAHSFSILILLRMGTAIGVAGCRPAGGSLIAEMFDAEHRAIANAFFSWGLYFGYSLSFLFGIYVTEADLFGLGWRSAYILAGLLGLPIAALLFTIEEPRDAVVPPIADEAAVPPATRRLSYSTLQNTITSSARKLSYPEPNYRPPGRKLSYSADADDRKFSTLQEEEEDTGTNNNNDKEPKVQQRRVSTTVLTVRRLSTTTLGGRRRVSCAGLEGYQRLEGAEAALEKRRKGSAAPISNIERKLSAMEMQVKDSEAGRARKPSIQIGSGIRKLSLSVLEKTGADQTLSYSRTILRALLKPVIILLFITASIRHTAGYAWSHNNVNYFNHYHQGKEIGYWFTVCSILGGSVGVVTGGYISDSIVTKLGLSSRLWLLRELSE